MRTLILAAALAAAFVSPQLAQAQAAATSYSTNETTIGALLDNPATRAILDKHLPGLSSDPQIEMGRGMTLKQVQQFAPDRISDDVLAKIDADLTKLPVKK